MPSGNTSFQESEKVYTWWSYRNRDLESRESALAKLDWIMCG